MAKQDEYARYTIRIPQDVYRAIEEAASAANRSVNAEIQARLQRSVDEERFIKAGPGELAPDAYLARMTEERLRFEQLLGQYTAIFKGFTPADINRMFADYEALRKKIDETGKWPEDHPFKLKD